MGYETKIESGGKKNREENLILDMSEAEYTISPLR